MRRNRGFTLIELMIVVSVIAVLAAIALPAYNDHVRKTRRSEATSGLNQLALLQERWRANRPTYGSITDIGGGGIQSAYYTFRVTVNTATAYTMTATPQGVQTSDTTCGTLTYAYQAGTVTRTPTTAGCWN